METLQPPEWVATHGARPGARVPMPLELREMGSRADSVGVVVSNGPCPEIQPGRGRVVLGTVNHLNTDVLELTITDQRGHQELVRPTARHKFFSADRQQWIPASELNIGEHLAGADGQLTLVNRTHLPGKHRVYNMTVEEEHVYHVSLLGALVHNNKCFPPGTLVLMADGTTRAIERICQGDLVLSMDPERREPPSPRRVGATFKDWTQCLVHVELGGRGALTSARDLVATRWHPIWTKNRKWQYAVNLRAGDSLVDDQRADVPVLGVRQQWKPSDTYNFCVPGLHTYFVVIGGKPVLVHNADMFPGDEQIPPIIYRGGKTNPGNLTPRPSDNGILSFRDSFTEPIAPGRPGPYGAQPVFRDGEPYFTVDTAKLPPGSVIPDNVPPGHVSVNGVPPDVVKAAVLQKFPGS